MMMMMTMIRMAMMMATMGGHALTLDISRGRRRPPPEAKNTQTVLGSFRGQHQHQHHIPL